jgi:polysaccharide export outer membrane protein
MGRVTFGRSRHAAMAAALAIALLLAAVAGGGSASAQTDRGQLSVTAGDVLSVTVFGRADLSGDFQVAPDGTIALPLAGSMKAAGLTPSDLSSQIETALLQYIPGLSVTVAISKFAPVFVVGEVQAPGRYEYRPGMTTLELFALAGGLRRAPAEKDTVSLQIIQVRQDLQDLDLQIFAQQAARERLQAELDDTDYAAAMPPSATDATSRGLEQRMVESQATLFRIRKAALDAQERGLDAQAASYDDEISTLSASIKLHNDEIGLLEEDVAAQKSLVERGLTAKSNLREIERLLSSTRRDALELSSFLARARQNKLGLEQRRTELTGIRRDEAAKQMQDIEIALARFIVRRDGLIRTIGELAQMSGSDVLATADLQPSYRIMRMVDGAYQQVEAGEQEMIRPNDILTVRLPDLRTASSIQ